MTAEEPSADLVADRYKWVVLTNTTLGVLVVTINSSIVIISLPAIFRGIRLDLIVATDKLSIEDAAEVVTAFLTVSRLR